MNSRDLGGWVVAALLVAWVGAVAASLLAASDGEPETLTAGTPTPEATAAELPVRVEFGEELDPATGTVAAAEARFASGSTIHFSGWLGTPVGVSELTLTLSRIHPDPYGFNLAVPVPVDPQTAVVSGEIPVDRLLTESGAGAYGLVLYRNEDEPIAMGVFQIESEVPEEVRSLLGWRSVALRPGEHTGYRFDASGEVLETHSTAVDSDLQVHANVQATFAGQSYLFLVDGPLALYWVLESESVSLGG